MMNFLQEVWSLLNTPAAITAVAGLLVWALNKLYAKKPTWQKYEGTIISAVKFAEKEIPAGSKGSGLAKLHTALDYVINVFTQVEGRQATADETASLKDGIAVVHNQLAAQGTLNGSDSSAHAAASTPTTAAKATVAAGGAS